MIIKIFECPLCLCKFDEPDAEPTKYDRDYIVVCPFCGCSEIFLVDDEV